MYVNGKETEELDIDIIFQSRFFSFEMILLTQRGWRNRIWGEPFRF